MYPALSTRRALPRLLMVNFTSSYFSSGSNKLINVKQMKFSGLNSSDSTVSLALSKIQNISSSNFKFYPSCINSKQFFSQKLEPGELLLNGKTLNISQTLKNKCRKLKNFPQNLTRQGEAFYCNVVIQKKVPA